MTINRDKRTVYIAQPSSEVDDYGQFVPGTSYEVQMSVYPYQQSNNDSINYVDVEMVGVTEADINAGDEVTIGTEVFRVKFTQKARRRNISYLTKLGSAQDENRV